MHDHNCLCAYRNTRRILQFYLHRVKNILRYIGLHVSSSVAHFVWKIKQFETPFTLAKKPARHAKFLAPCLNYFGTALPIYTTQNKRFFSSWVRFQFLIGTPSLHLFYSREMADKQLAFILHHILRVKCDLNRNRKSRHRLTKETHRHLGEMRKKDGRRNVHSRPQSLRSFWPAAGIKTSGSNHFEITKEITEFSPSGLT